MVQNLYHPNFYIRISSGDLEKGLLKFNLTLFLKSNLTKLLNSNLTFKFQFFAGIHFHIQQPKKNWTQMTSLELKQFQPYSNLRNKIKIKKKKSFEKIGPS